VKNIERLLNSIGKETFVKYFDAFRKQYDTQELIKVFRKGLENWSEDSCKTKANAGRKLFYSNLEKEALVLIIESNPNKIGGGIETINIAKRLISEL